MLRDFWEVIPTWIKVLWVIFLVAGVAAAVYTFKECGTKALFLGNGGLYAAATGMCE
jgi:hypothetical protein